MGAKNDPIGWNGLRNVKIVGLPHLSFERLLVNVAGHHQGRGAREAGSLPGPDELDVAGHGVFGHARLEPGLAKLVAGLMQNVKLGRGWQTRFGIPNFLLIYNTELPIEWMH